MVYYRPLRKKDIVGAYYSHLVCESIGAYLVFILVDLTCEIKASFCLLCGMNHKFLMFRLICGSTNKTK